MMDSPEKLPLLEGKGKQETIDQEAKSSLLQRHLGLFNDLIKVQPQRHTEQQLKLERQKKNNDLLEGKQSELDRIRLEYQVQNTGNKSRKGVNLSDTDFESQRREMIKRQREMEQKRNEEESSLIIDQGKEERRNKTSKVKWYEKGYERKTNEVITRNDQGWNQYKQRSIDNIWTKRKEQQFRQKEELQTLLPKNESDEELMLRKAIELSKLAARETSLLPRNATKQIQSIWDIDYINAEPPSTDQQTTYNVGYANALKKTFTLNNNKHQSNSQVNFQSRIKESINNTGQNTRLVGHEDMKGSGNDGCSTTKRKISEESFLKRAESSRTLSKGNTNTSKAVSGKGFLSEPLSGSQESNMAELNHKKIKTDFGQTGDLSVGTEDWNAECDYWNVYTRPSNDQQYPNTETCSSDGSDLCSDSSETDENYTLDIVKQSKFGNVKDKQSGNSRKSCDVVAFNEDSVGEKNKQDSEICGKINKNHSSNMDMDSEVLYSHRQMSPVGITDPIITSDISTRNAMTGPARKASIDNDNKNTLKKERSVTKTIPKAKSVKFAAIETPPESAAVDIKSKYKQTVVDKINISKQENKRVLKIPRLPVSTSNPANCSVKHRNSLQNPVQIPEKIAVDALSSLKPDLQKRQVGIQIRQALLKNPKQLSTCKENLLKDEHVYKIECGAKFETEAKNHGKQAGKGVTSYKALMQLPESASGQSLDTSKKPKQQMKLNNVQQPIPSVCSGRIFPVSQHINDLYQDIPNIVEDDLNQEVYIEPCQITQTSSKHSNLSQIHNIPEGLPAHLYQEYYQFLQQTNVNNSEAEYSKDNQELLWLSQSKMAHPGLSGPLQVTQTSSELRNPPHVDNIPQGLPAHLHQAYFQYLQQPQKTYLKQNHTGELVQQNTIGNVDEDRNQYMPYIDQCISPFISSSVGSKYTSNMLMGQTKEMYAQSTNSQAQECVEDGHEEDCTAMVIGLKGKLGMSSESELRIPRLPAVASLLTRKNLKALNIDPSLYVKRKIESVKSSRQQKTKTLQCENNLPLRENFQRRPDDKENSYWCGRTRNLPSVPELGQTDEECCWKEKGNPSSTIDHLGLKTDRHNSSHEQNKESDSAVCLSPKTSEAAEIHAKHSYIQISSKQNQIYQKLVMKEYGEMTNNSLSVVTETGEGCHVKSSADSCQSAAQQNQMIRDMITGMRRKENLGKEVIIENLSLMQIDVSIYENIVEKVNCL